ncbi:MAG: DNA translocase FtsK [Prevotellaceae bacterium]|jgi:S-DNA-T family DNA segregation ATPase FtsK/SpoIIIE|nr:DNA translocase FtsK [Prevotellaceae bacterium]
MAKKKNEKSSGKPARKPNAVVAFLTNETFLFIVGFLLITLTAYLIYACYSFLSTSAADQSLLDGGSSGQSRGFSNGAGSLGARAARFLVNDCFGLATFFLLAFLLLAGLKLVRAYKIAIGKWFVSCVFLTIWFSLFLGYVCYPFYEGSSYYWGGLHGYNIGRWLEQQVGAPGVWLILLVTAVLFFIYLSTQTVIWVRGLLGLRFMPKRKPKPVKETKEEPIPFTVDTPATSPSDEDIPFEIEPPQVENSFSEAEDLPSEPETTDETVFEIDDELPEGSEAYEGTIQTPYNPKLDLENYKLPTLDLLKYYDGSNEPTIDMEEQTANKNKIVETLRSFGIEISSIKATPGPTVTLYEITPAQGVRISKIRNLEDDIALSLAALGIRIIAPIPGKGTIGIEVPNSNPKIVSMQSIIGSKKFQESTFDLPIALGKTITNEVFMVDLCKMPHLLVAGATGQGKSVGLNAIITSLLYKKHPAELKFVLVDPKKVEFSIYESLENHFLAKLPDSGEAIITDVSKVVQTLNSLCVEMDSRYDLLKKAEVRNVKEYNEKFINRKLNPNNGHRYMPYIVVIIDEFGDLIMTAGREVELPIARIAQLARAVGIHMVIATQRPTTNIITGTIKANFPARIAFRVSAMIDSRTILDRPGANQLIGRGDMLFLQGEAPVRIQCAFVDTPEVENMVKYIARQQSYPTAFLLPEPINEGGGSDLSDVDMGKLDPLFEEAARLIVVHQSGSTSLIQRKFAIGYNRAGRLMDQLEKAGIVGAIEGSKPREVLCATETDLEMKLNNIR